MTKEKILEKLLAVNGNGLHGDGYFDYSRFCDLVEALKQDIRDENNRKSGHGNAGKLAKAIMKNANPEMMQYAHTVNGVQYVLDGYRIAGFMPAIDLPEWREEEHDGRTWFRIENMMHSLRVTATPLELPSIGDLKAAIKIHKAEKKTRTIYSFGEVCVNAQYLLDFMEGFGEDMKIYPSEDKPERNALFIQSDSGIGVLLPILATNLIGKVGCFAA